MIRKPFNFSPDLSQKMHLEDREDEEDDEDDDEVSFLSMLRKEAEEKVKQESLTDTQRLMQTQDNEVETRVVTTITCCNYYMRNGQRVVVSTDGPNVYTTGSVKTTIKPTRHMPSHNHITHQP
mgnify:CR=1 FL=1